MVEMTLNSHLFQPVGWGRVSGLHIEKLCEKWLDYPFFLALKTNNRNLVGEISAAKVIGVYVNCTQVRAYKMMYNFIL